MTAIRVITDHEELDGSGRVSHERLDTLITGSAFLVVSGTGPLPDSARRLVAGPGIAITDTGPGGTLTISTTTSGSTGQQISWVEIPSGTVDGANKDFTLAHVPVPLSALMFFMNGVLQRQGLDSDYIMVSGSTIHILNGYRSGSNLAATYPF